MSDLATFLEMLQLADIKYSLEHNKECVSVIIEAGTGNNKGYNGFYTEVLFEPYPMGGRLVSIGAWE